MTLHNREQAAGMLRRLWAMAPMERETPKTALLGGRIPVLGIYLPRMIALAFKIDLLPAIDRVRISALTQSLPGARHASAESAVRF